MNPADLRDLETDALVAKLNALATARYGARWQTALARDFGYSPRAVAYWTRGNRRPPIELVLALHFLQQPAQLAEAAQLARLAKLTADRLDAALAKLAGPRSEPAPTPSEG